MIWIRHIWMKKEDQLFADSEYLFIIQLFNIKLERVTERGYTKLSPNKVEVMDVRFGRSKNQFIHINITFHYQWTRWIIWSSLKCTTTKFDRIQMWKIYSLFKSFKYLILLLIRNAQMHYHLIQWNSNEEDLFISNITLIIPCISNEEPKKLYESILIVDNLGRLTNSNLPE